MKLKKAIALHRANSRGGLSQNFGDGYLVKNNKIYGNVRREVQRLGYQFTTDRLFQYDALALSQIHHLIRHRRIPYIDNVTVLKEIEALRPGEFDWNEIPDLRRNILFHESAHCVARDRTKKWFSKPSTNDRVLTLLLEESFANTCDAFVGAASKLEAHRIFSFLNCYTLFEEKPNPHDLLKEAKALIGERALFQISLLLYLHANFLCENFDLNGFSELLETVLARVDKATGRRKNPGRRDLKKLHRSLSFPFLLSLIFRYRTNDFYFRLQGFKGPVEKILAFDHIHYISDREDFWGCLNDLTDLALK